jgi:hypothetical protein
MSASQQQTLPTDGNDVLAQGSQMQSITSQTEDDEDGCCCCCHCWISFTPFSDDIYSYNEEGNLVCGHCS